MLVIQWISRRRKEKTIPIKVIGKWEKEIRKRILSEIRIRAEKKIIWRIGKKNKGSLNSKWRVGREK